MDAEKPCGERAAPVSMDFTQPEDLTSYQSVVPDTSLPSLSDTDAFALSPNGQSNAKEPTVNPDQKEDSPVNIEKEAPTDAVSLDSSMSQTHVMQLLEVESTATGDKQLDVIVSAKSLEVPGTESASSDKQEGTMDKSGMSAYFETTTLKSEETRGQGEDYYELSTASDETKSAISSVPEISYSTLVQSQSIDEIPESQKGTEEKQTVLPSSEKRDDCKLSPGKLALEQRSYSLNITIGTMDQSGGQGRPRNFSPLATDIMSYTSGSLDESTDCIPVSPSVEKLPSFPPLILETSASVTTPSASPPHDTVADIKTTSPQPESPGSPLPNKFNYKNGAVMAQDLPEMLDLAGTRTRLMSDNTDPEIIRRKSVPADMPALVSDSLAHLFQGQRVTKSETQLEEHGYCVFSEYSGPMPSPADVHSPLDSPPTQIFNRMISEEKETIPNTSGQGSPSSKVLKEDISPETEEEKDTREIMCKNNDDGAEQPSNQVKTFATPTVTVTLEGVKTDLDEEAKLAAEQEAEIADYERQIRKLEMEDRPLSVEEERELQELREKVKNKPDLVHQEAYEEVDAEDVYQLTGVAKDRIARPIRPSPTSSVESGTEEEKVPVDTEKPKPAQDGQKEEPAKLSPAESVEKPREDHNLLQSDKENETMEEKSQLEIAMAEQAPVSTSVSQSAEEEIEVAEEPMEYMQAEKADLDLPNAPEILEKVEPQKTEQDQSEVKQIETELVEKDDKPKVVEKHEEPKVVEKDEESKVVEKNKEDKGFEKDEEHNIVEKYEEPQSVQKEQEFKLVEKDEGPTVVEKHEELKVVKDEEPKVVGKDEEPKVVEKDKEPSFVEKDEEPKVVENDEETRVVEKVEEPEVVDKHAETGLDEKDEKTGLVKDKVEEHDELVGAGAAVQETIEPRAAIESVVTVEDDFITVVQTIDEREVPGHSVRFSTPPEEESPQMLQDEEEEEDSIEMAQEAEMEAASLEEVQDAPEAVQAPVCPPKEVPESECPTESYDDYKDETTIDDSILDSSWVDTQGDAMIFLFYIFN